MAQPELVWQIEDEDPEALAGEEVDYDYLEDPEDED